MPAARAERAVGPPGQRALARLRAVAAGAVRRAASRLPDEAGFSLVEVLIAFTVLMIVLVPVASVLANSIGQAATSRERLTALSVAEQYIERLNNSGPHVTTTSGQPVTDTTVLETPAPLKRSGVSYSVDSRFAWAAAEGASPDLCTSGASPKVMDLQVTVHWNPSQKVTDTTIVNYPPAGLPTQGFLAVQVDGDPASAPPADAGSHAWASRVTAVPVTLRSPPAPATATYTKTVYPDRYGCAFEQIPPGSYTVTVADPAPGTPPGTTFGGTDTPSWVANADERTTGTLPPLTVDAGQVTQATFQYDEGSLVDLRYPSTTATDGGVSCPSAGSILCLATGQAPAHSTAPASTPVAELSVLTSAGWSVERPSGITRIAGTSCAGTVRCVAVGYVQAGPTGPDYGASVSSPTSSSPSFALDNLPNGITSLDGVTCPGPATCYATGTGSAGPVVLSGAVSATGIGWTSDALPPGTTAVSDVTCPAAATCFALGSQAAGPSILSLSTGNAWTATVLPLPPTPPTTGLRQLACPSTTTCYAIGSVASGAEILSLFDGGWVPDTLPATPAVSALGQVTCPTTTTCYAIGSTTSGGVLLSLSTSSATTWTADSAPATASLSELACASDASCVAVGSTSSATVLLRRTGAATWAAGTFPAGMALDSLSDAGCSTTDRCFAIGSATASGGAAQAVILSRGSGTAWVDDTLPPTGKAPVFFSGIACTASVCTAPGATETGAVYLDGTVTGKTWTTATPGGVQGMYVADAPIAVSDPNLKTSSTLVVTAPASDASQIGPLYPFAAGYSIAAAECASEMSAASATVASVPGGTSTADLPMGLLPVAVVDSAGHPVPGANVVATLVTSPPGTCLPLPPLSGTDPTSYALPKTGPSGLSDLAVTYDTYQLTVTGRTGSTVVQVTPTASVVAGTPEPLPEPVTVTVT
ncbi:MAG: prepilin-type N-terminal cleavage/methylation domain-containing protein [Acidimicrobiales bacterium]